MGLNGAQLPTHPHLGPPLEGEDEKCASRNDVAHLGRPLEGEMESKYYWLILNASAARTRSTP